MLGLAQHSFLNAAFYSASWYKHRLPYKLRIGSSQDQKTD